MLNKISKVMLETEVVQKIDKIDGLESSLAENAYVNIKKFAKGDGIIDDTQAINDAIAYAVSINNRRLYVPKGTFLINGVNSIVFDEGNILIPSNFEIWLDSEAVIKVIPNNAWGYSIFNLTNVENVYIHGGVFEGDRDSHNYSGYPTHPTNEWGYGVRGHDCKNIVIRDSVFKNFTGDGINFSGTQLGVTTNENILIDNVIVDRNRRNGIAFTNGKNIKIKNATCINTNGISPMAGIDIEGEAHTVEDVVIESCYFQNNTSSGIQLLNCKNVKVSNSHFNNQNYGILEVRQISNINVLGNTFFNDTKRNVIQIKGSFLNFSNNILTKCNIALYNEENQTYISDVIISQNTMIDSGILIVGNVICRNVLVNGNSFSDLVDSAGIFLFEPSYSIDNLKISSNTFYNIDGEAVLLNGKNLSIENNRIEKCSTHAIHLKGQSPYALVKGNMIKEWGMKASSAAIYNYGSSLISILDNLIIVTDNVPVLSTLTGIYAWGNNPFILNNRFFKEGVNVGHTGIQVWSAGTVLNGNDVRGAFTTPIKIESTGVVVDPSQNYI